MLYFFVFKEILKGFSYSTKADIWSLGVCVFECLYGYCPFEERSIGKLITLIDTSMFSIPKSSKNKISP